MAEINTKITRIEIDNEEYLEDAERFAGWDTYVYTFSGKKFKLNPYFVEHDKTTQMLIENKVYVKVE